MDYHKSFSILYLIESKQAKPWCKPIQHTQIKPVFMLDLIFSELQYPFTVPNKESNATVMLGWSPAKMLNAESLPNLSVEIDIADPPAPNLRQLLSPNRKLHVMN